ncbi:unnamed protein product, partial [Brassica oleracea var. botrytis]
EAIVSFQELSCFTKKSGSRDYICDGGVCVLRSSNNPTLEMG